MCNSAFALDVDKVNFSFCSMILTSLVVECALVFLLSSLYTHTVNAIVHYSPNFIY